MGERRNLKGHTGIVTGAAGGIGFEFAKRLAEKGASLILIDINETRLDEAAEILKKLYPEAEGEKVFTLPLDLTSPALTEKLDNFCEENNLDPDILINNAGIFSFREFTETPRGKIDAFLDLHVRAVTYLSQWFAERRKSKGSGWLLNMSSMSCWMPMPGLALYSSTKSFIRVFTRSLHYEMRDYGVGVTVACPGGIATDLYGLPKKWQNFAVNIGVLQTPEKFTRKAVKKMLKKRKQYINGGLNRISILFVGSLPSGVRMMVKHKMLDKGIAR